jgi:hypothetical protein
LPVSTLNPDFRDILSCFSAERVEYLVVGAYALAAHGLPRATGDIDLWVRPSSDNAARVARALLTFGAPADRFTQEDFESDDLIVQLGVPPGRVDVITSIEAVTFEEAWPNRLVVDLDGLAVTVLGREELLRNKRAVGRPQDQADVARLEAQARGRRHSIPSSMQLRFS